jgi:4,5-DOPA dioxygenase extradiol
MRPETEKKSDSHLTAKARPMPAVFFGHGSPMNALEQNRYTASWRTFGETIPRPRAILVVSAHWYVNATAVTAMPRPRTIHDFYGFPKELFEVEYPAPGSPELAEEVAEIVKPKHVGLDQDSWGIDHGTWSVLLHAFPKADIPVVQLSIHALSDFDSHFELGARLAPLRERGVLIVGSGNIVHNLRSMQRTARSDQAYDWAIEFDKVTGEHIAQGHLDALPGFQSLGQVAQMAHPTYEHYLPLLYAAGAVRAGEAPQFFNTSFQGASISMRSVIWG